MDRADGLPGGFRHRLGNHEQHCEHRQQQSLAQQHLLGRKGVETDRREAAGEQTVQTQQFAGQGRADGQIVPGH